MVDERTTVGTVQAHVVVENVVAPEGLTQSLQELTCTVLLPVQPPEVNALTLAGTQDSVEHRVVEFSIREVPRHALHIGWQSHIVADVVEEFLVVVDAISRMQVQCHLQVLFVHEIDEPFGIGNDGTVPRPARPAFGVPVHIENHHIHRNLVLAHVGGYLHEFVGGVALIFAVPVAQHVERWHRLAACYLREVAQSLAIIVTVAHEIPIYSLFVNGFSHPWNPIHIAIEGECRRTVAPFRAR